MKDRERINKFLKEFTSKLSKKYPEEIDFILLFGSAARGDWKKGISDVDLVIQVKRQEYIYQVKECADKIFWELDKKHGTQLKKACSTGDKKDIVKKALRKTELYVPYEVFGPKDIDWKNGWITKKELVLGARIVASQAMLFKKMKQEGQILYGRDVRKIIHPKITKWEKIKAILIPYHIALSSVFLSLISPKIALKIADKAAIYSISSTLFFLNKPAGKGLKIDTQRLEKEIRTNFKYKRSVLGMMEVDFVLNFDYRKLLNFKFASEAIKLKDNWGETQKFSRWKTLKFSLRSLFFVNAMNWYAVLRSDKYHIILISLVVIRTILFFLIFWIVIKYL